MTDNNDPNDSGDNSTVDCSYTRETDGDLKVEETQEYGTSTDRKVTYEYDLAGGEGMGRPCSGRRKYVQ